MAFLRIAISSLAFLPLFIIYYKKIDWSKLKYLLVVGLAGSGIPSFLYAIAQTEIDSNVAGILNSLTPLFTLILGITVFKLESDWSKLKGTLIGFCGALVIILFGQKVGAVGSISAVLLIVLGTILYATSVNTVKKYLQEMDPFAISSAAFFIIGIPAFVYILFSDLPSYIMTSNVALSSLAYIAILSIFSTVIATIIFYKLVQQTNAVWASSVAYFIPVAALLWGLFDHEIISIWHIIGLLLIVLGVYLTKK